MKTVWRPFPLGFDPPRSLFKIMQKAGVAAHSSTLNVSPLSPGCRQALYSCHHFFYKITRAESKELSPFSDKVDELPNSLQYTEMVSLAVLPLLQLGFFSAGLTKHRAARRVSMKYKVHGALIQCPFPDLPGNFQPTWIQQWLVTH